MYMSLYTSIVANKVTQIVETTRARQAAASGHDPQAQSGLRHVSRQGSSTLLRSCDAAFAALYGRWVAQALQAQSAPGLIMSEGRPCASATIWTYRVTSLNYNINVGWQTLL